MVIGSWLERTVARSKRPWDAVQVQIQLQLVDVQQISSNHMERWLLDPTNWHCWKKWLGCVVMWGAFYDIFLHEDRQQKKTKRKQYDRTYSHCIYFYPIGRYLWAVLLRYATIIFCHKRRVVGWEITVARQICCVLRGLWLLEPGTDGYFAELRCATKIGLVNGEEIIGGWMAKAGCTTNVLDTSCIYGKPHVLLKIQLRS